MGYDHASHDHRTALQRAQANLQPRETTQSHSSGMSYDEIADVFEWNSWRQWEWINGSIVMPLAEFGRALVSVWHALGIR
jgi:hypothetical protein